MSAGALRDKEEEEEQEQPHGSGTAEHIHRVIPLGGVGVYST